MIYRDEAPPSFLGIAILSCVLCGGLGAGMAHSAYGKEIGISNPTWILGVGIMVFGVLVLPVIDWANRKSRSVYRIGTNGLAAVIGISYFLTNSAISPFIVMPMHPWLRTLGLLLCVGGNLWWCAAFIRIYQKIYRDKVLFNRLYIDAGDFYVMKPARDAIVIEKKLKFDQMRPAYLLIPIMPIIPFSLVLPKLLEPVIGFSGFWTFAAFVAIPLSMILNGMLVKGVLMFFYFPFKWTRLTGKPVHYARYWDIK